MTQAEATKTTGAENVIWDLSIFYQNVNDPRIEQDLTKAEQMADEFATKYRGRVAALDPEEMVDALVESEAIQDFDGRIGTFAYLNFATDSADPEILKLISKVQEHGARMSQKMLFFELEWKAAPQETVDAMLANPTLGKYRHVLESELRYRPHMLSEIEEKLLVEKSVTGRSAWQRFFTQLMAATRYEVDGQKLTQSQVLNLTHDPDRAVRLKAADAITKTLKELTMQTTFITNVLAQDKAADDTRRKYESWISSRNLANKASDETVEALIKAVTSNYEIVARHYNVKREILGYDELYDYDRYAPLPIESAGREYTWEEAKEIVLNAYYAFSQRMGEIAQKFFDENWIHAALMPNKRGGAFASPSVPSAHPFVFVNFTGSARDVMTLAHELGHGLHMYLSAEAQGITGLYTPLTTAEMASVFGEMLVFTDLMNKESNPAARLAMLAQRIEDSFATVFRQVSMNRYEDAVHNRRRTEGELSTETLNQIWRETQQAMFGDSVNMREDYGLWWSYIPHVLQTPGYVYAYAFGELLVMALFNIYRKRGGEFVPQYLEVLAAGDSDYPHNILSKVGVDLNDTAFWNEGLAALTDLVDQELELAKQVYPDKQF